MKKIISVVAILTVCFSGFSQFFEKTNLLYNWGIPSPIFFEIASRNNSEDKPQIYYAVGIYDKNGLEYNSLVGFKEVTDSKESDMKIEKTIYTDSIVLSGIDPKNKKPVFIYSFLKKDNEYVVHSIRVNDKYGLLLGMGKDLSNNASNYYQHESKEIVSFTFYSNGKPTSVMYCDHKNSKGNSLIVFDSIKPTAKYGLFNPTTRKFIFPMEYQKMQILTTPSSSFIVAKKNGKSAIFDMNGVAFTSFIFENEITNIFDGKSIEVKNGAKTCLLNLTGDTLFSLEAEDFKYCTLLKSKYGFYFIVNSIGYTKGFVTPSGEIVKTDYYDYTAETGLQKFDKEFDENGILIFYKTGTASADYKDSETCLITKEGKIIRDYHVHYSQKYSEGLCVVSDKETEKKFGFINNKGAIVIPLIYNEASSFAKGKSLVKLNGEYFYINKLGNKVPD